MYISYFRCLFPWNEDSLMFTYNQIDFIYTIDYGH